jgi:outer membrane protein insertion porin family
LQEFRLWLRFLGNDLALTAMLSLSRRYLLLIIYLSAQFGVVSGQTVPKEAKQIPLALTPSTREQFIDGRTLVRRTTFTGLDTDDRDYGIFVENPVYESDLLKELEYRKIKIEEGEKYSSEKVGKIVAFLKELLAERGYLKANVTAWGSKSGKNGMSVRFAVERGPTIKVSEILVAGNSLIPSEAFVTEFKKCSGNNWETFKRSNYEFYSNTCLRRLMWSEGFFKARINGISAGVVEDSYHVKIMVDEGLRYRWGEFMIKGAKEFSRSEILNMMGITPGGIADGRKLGDFIYKELVHEYKDRGYLELNAEFDPELKAPSIDGLDGIADISITIDEGRQYYLRGVTFVGVSAEENRKLAAEFPLKSGDLFAFNKFESGIEDLNKTERFFFIDKDQHAEIRLDDELGNVDLNIRLNKRP